MQYFRYDIHRNESINRWRVTDVRKQYFESPTATFEAEVNPGEGYVQIVYPVREAFLRSHDLQAAKRYEGEFGHVYFPFENTRVDFSTFIHTPHTLSVNAKTAIAVPQDGRYEFDVYTCGGIKLWLDGKEVLTFGPYTRNIPGKTRLTLDLSTGVHTLEAYADELAERDVFFYFEIRYLGERTIEGMVEIEEDPQLVKSREAFLKSLYVEHGVYEEGNLEIGYDGSLLDEDLEVRISGTSDFAASGRWTGPDRFIARKGARSTVIASVDDCPLGGCTFEFQIDIGRYQVRRKTFFSIASKKLVSPPTPATYENRQASARAFVCEHGDRQIMRAMVMMEAEHRMSAQARSFIDASLKKIRDKADCADFVLVPLLWSLTTQRSYYDPKYLSEIEEIILDFRYWIDEPGNDVMWYFSENHAFLFHCAQYLAGHLFPDRIFKASGRKGARQREIGYERLLSWFGNFEQYHYGEWNSPTYLPIDFLGLFTLYEVAPDNEIRERSKSALDYTFGIIANNTYRGIMTSSYGRCYEKTLKSRTEIETSFLSWIAYGVGRMTSSNRAAALMSLSSYTPPKHADFELGEGKALIVKAVQGQDPVYTYLYRTDHYSMGSANRFKCFRHGHQQHVFDVSFGTKNRQFYVNHPGEKAFSGENRPSYWAGNGTCPMVVQYKALALLMFDIDPEELVHYIHTWSPLADYDEYRTEGNYLFMRIDDSYVSAYFSNGYEITRSGINTDKEVISRGLSHFVAVRCSDKREASSFDDFIRNVRSGEITYDPVGHRASYEDFNYGKLSFDERETRLNGQTVADTWADAVIEERY